MRSPRELEPIAGSAEGGEAAVERAIGLCAVAIGDRDRLRVAVDALEEASAGARGALAWALYVLELARRGEDRAREQLALSCEVLLAAFRSPSIEPWLGGDPSVAALWTDAFPLLAGFALHQLDEAITACFEVRHEVGKLRAALAELKPAGNRRVEFASCLFHLELARLGVESSKREFALRAELLREAFLAQNVAVELMGDHPALVAMWTELFPYLEEFFDVEEAEVLDATPAHGSAPPPPPEPRDLTPPPGPAPASSGAGPPPPPRSLTPPVVPSFSELASAFAEPLEIIDVVEPEDATLPGAPPPLPSDTFDALPAPRTLEFWRHVEQCLEILPVSGQPRLDHRVFASESKSERKKLEAIVADAKSKFADAAPAGPFSCLLSLYLAAQVRDRTLFGQPNPKRREAFRDALKLLGGDPRAAGQCAVYLELDGLVTQAQLHEGLMVLYDYLGFCLERGLDPLGDETPQAYFEF